jgi:hypothetical protein
LPDANAFGARLPNSPPEIVIPPGKSSIPDRGQPHGGSERERHAAEIAARGRITSRTFGAQQNEIAIHIKIASCHMTIARPVSERVR